MADKFTIANMFAADDEARQGSLEQARLAAALTIPHVLPPSGQSENDELPKNFQSVGSRGIAILTGRLMLAIYPPGTPWFVLTLPPEMRYSTEIDPSFLQEQQQLLFLYGHMLVSQLESLEVSPEAEGRRTAIGFRSHKVATIQQILITGDALERVHKDYRMQLFDRDSYVTKRCGSKEVQYHITKQRVDGRDLKPEEFEKSGLPRDKFLDDEMPSNRMTDLYTWINWEHNAKSWSIKQEVNENIVKETVEQVSPYISTPFELTRGDYGRGFIESQNIGDLRSLDELELRLLDLLALAAKQQIGKDPSSMVRDSDLRGPTGSIVPGVRMVGGVAQDIGPIAFASPRDFQMLINGVERKTAQLAKSMLIESDTTRKAERVTTVEINRNVQELQSALGGVYTSVADEQQVPLQRRLIHQFNLDHKLDLPRTPDGRSALEMRSLTGIAALSNNNDIQKLLTSLQVLQTMGPEALQRIDIGVAVDILFRQIGYHEPGLVKSNEQIEREQAAAMQQQVALQAAQQTVQSTGRIAEQDAKAKAEADNREPRQIEGAAA